MNNQMIHSTIIRDSKKFSDFYWFGAIDDRTMSEWLTSQNLVLPSDLIDFWKLTGGGDIFENETILGPFGNPELGDDIVGCNQYHYLQGLAKEYLLFHCSYYYSAVHLPTLKYVTLNDKYKVLKTFENFDEWYKKTIREGEVGDEK